MSQTRYRTLLSHLAQVFQAGDGERTGRLQAGLDDIVAKIDPQDAKTWQLVKDDSERLLRVWVMREERALMEQILGALSDYATSAVDPAPPIRNYTDVHPCVEEKEILPSLVVTETVVPPTPAAVPCMPIEVYLPASPLITTVDMESKDSKENEKGMLEPDAEEEAEGSVVEPEAEAEAEEAEETEAEAEAEAEEAEAEGSVVEPDAEEEAEDEEEGMEVDKVVIRGRSYWMDTNTKKLYAVVDDDDVGDEVGAIVNGKAVFVG